jgi:hypothetical protein
MEINSLGPVASNCGIEKQDFTQFLKRACQVFNATPTLRNKKACAP